jgi:uncharacterized protein YPO0396
MSEHADLQQRLDALRARARKVGADERVLAQMEDLLAEGYARALAGEAGSRRLGQRLEMLMPRMEEPATAKEARRLALQRRNLDETVAKLRAELAGMREEYVALSGSRARSD